jgi:LexA-binding, inner membrane-associated putative hydrolase
MSWAAHEFEIYFIQKHTGVKASFFGVVVGTLLPDLFTKWLVYQSDNPAKFHRGWPGVGFTHSLLFGFAVALLVLALTKSRAWAVGILIGQWAHVLTDVSDTAGVMPFFPFSTENVTISMWKHAAVQGRFGDAAAYYSSLGGVWDLFWCVVLVLFARQALSERFFKTVVVPGDPKAWAWLHRRLHLSPKGLLLLYRGWAFYGLSRMISWFLYARFDVEAPFQPIWGGPRFVVGNDLSDAGWLEVLTRTAIGGVLFVAFLWLCWVVFARRLWNRGEDAPSVQRGRGLRAVLH